MQFRPELPERNVWFFYSRRRGKITGAPTNAKGWLALAGCIAITLLVGLTVSRWALAFHPVFGFVALFGVVLLGVLLTIKLVMTKGQHIN